MVKILKIRKVFFTYNANNIAKTNTARTEKLIIEFM